MDSSKVEYIQKFCTVSWRPLPVPFRLLGFVIAALFLMVGPTRAAQVRLPEGTMVRLKLLYNITTENVARGDRVEFDVAENVMSNDRVVIAKGAPAWGQVTEVKGAGKKKANDASVTFKLMAVKTVDNQQVALRVLPTKPRKSDSHDNEIEENSLIPGMDERTTGAARGRDYAAYTDQDASVNAPDAPPVSSKDEGNKGGGPKPLPPPEPPPEDAYVDFKSTPPGADVVIDSRFHGNTPMRIPLPPGRHLIEIRLAGHRTWVRNMVVDPGSKPSVRATLDQE
jgi:hypothetical protein